MAMFYSILAILRRKIFANKIYFLCFFCCCYEQQEQKLMQRCHRINICLKVVRESLQRIKFSFLHGMQITIKSNTIYYSKKFYVYYNFAYNNLLNGNTFSFVLKCNFQRIILGFSFVYSSHRSSVLLMNKKAFAHILSHFYRALRNKHLIYV